MKKQLLSILIITASLGACVGSKTNKGGTNSNDMNTEVTGKYWKLITLEGQQITMSADAEREAYFTLFPTDSSIKGHTGCNAFFGKYELIAGNRIRISNMGNTLKACAGVTYEKGFMEALQLADNYTIVNDTLSLNKARRAPLAVFEAVYMKEKKNN